MPVKVSNSVAGNVAERAVALQAGSPQVTDATPVSDTASRGSAGAQSHEKDTAGFSRNPAAASLPTRPDQGTVNVLVSEPVLPPLSVTVKVHVSVLEL